MLFIKQPWHGKKLKKLLPLPKIPFLFQQQRGKALQLKPAFEKAEPGQKQRMVNPRLGVYSRGEFLSHGFPWMLLLSMRASGSQPTHRSLSRQQRGAVGVVQGTVSPSQPAGPALHWAVHMGPVRTVVEINAVKLPQKQHLPSTQPQPASRARRVWKDWTVIFTRGRD